jgi:hypothetical protein
MFYCVVSKRHVIVVPMLYLNKNDFENAIFTRELKNDETRYNSGFQEYPGTELNRHGPYGPQDFKSYVNLVFLF